MFPRFVKPAVVLAIGAIVFTAQTASAQTAGNQTTSSQTAWRSASGGYTATLAANFRILTPDPSKPDQASFSILTANVVTGYCSASVATPKTRVSSETWSTFITQYAGDGEALARSTSEKGGHTFIRFGGARPLTSVAGWAGYFNWFERINKDSGSNQITVNASTMLAEDARLVVVCSSVPGKLLSPADIDGAHLLAATFRKL